MRLTHFGGGLEHGTVSAVRDLGREVQVQTDGGDVLEFVLSRATGRFVCADGSRGPRLELLRER